MILAKHICGVETTPYEGSVVSTKLKISGVDVFSTGEFIDSPAYRNFTKRRLETYLQKILLRDNKMVGAVLFGDINDSAELQKLIKTRRK